MTKALNNSIGTAAGTAPPGVILLIGAGPLMLLDPPIPSLLDELRYPVREFMKGGPLGHRSVIRYYDSFAYDFRGRMGCPIALINRVRAHLEQRGIEIAQVLDYRAMRLGLAPDAAAIAAMSGRDRLIADRLVASERLCGQIEVGDQQVVPQILHLITCFHRARFLIVTPTMKNGHKIAGALEQAMGIEVEVAGRGRIPEHRWVTVSTFMYARDYQPHVIVLADAQDALANGARDQFAQIGSKPMRVIAFRRPALRLGYADEMRLEMMCGPVLYSRDPQRAEVRVSLCTARQFAPMLHTDDPLERKRQAFWHNDIRNDLIAQIASASAAGDLLALQSQGLMLETIDADWFSTASTIRTMVIVESVEHARELARRLPGFQVRTALPDGLSAIASATATAALAASKTKGAAPCVITTFSYASQHRTHADVLLRADGGPGPLPPLRGYPPPRSAVPAGRCMVIDILDDADFQGCRDTRSRLLYYSHQNWHVEPATLLMIDKAAHQQHTPSRRRVQTHPDSRKTQSLPRGKKGSTNRGAKASSRRSSSKKKSPRSGRQQKGGSSIPLLGDNLGQAKEGEPTSSGDQREAQVTERKANPALKGVKPLVHPSQPDSHGGESG